MVASNEMTSGDPGRTGETVQDQGARTETANRTPHDKTTTCGASANPTLRAQDDLIRRGDALAELNKVSRTYGETWEPHCITLSQKALAALPAAPTFTAADVERAYRLALRRAANCMNPAIRSMISRGEAYEAILSLTPPADLAQRVKE